MRGHSTSHCRSPSSTSTASSEATTWRLPCAGAGGPRGRELKQGVRMGNTPTRVWVPGANGGVPNPPLAHVRQAPAAGGGARESWAREGKGRRLSPPRAQTHSHTLPATHSHTLPANAPWLLCPETKEAPLLGPQACNRNRRWQKTLSERGWDNTQRAVSAQAHRPGAGVGPGTLTHGPVPPSPTASTS